MRPIRITRGPLAIGPMLMTSGSGGGPKPHDEPAPSPKPPKPPKLTWWERFMNWLAELNG